ncbi:MAG: hypothetical protein ACRD1K_05560 [Acidimicrobiales bacterium]
MTRFSNQPNIGKGSSRAGVAHSRPRRTAGHDPPLVAESGGRPHPAGADTQPARSAGADAVLLQQQGHQRVGGADFAGVFGGRLPLGQIQHMGRGRVVDQGVGEAPLRR